jgi:hypothetical protein
MRGNAQREISYWAMPKLTLDLRNPSLYSYKIQEFTDPYNVEFRLNVQLVDQGVSVSES